MWLFSSTRRLLALAVNEKALFVRQEEEEKVEIPAWKKLFGFEDKGRGDYNEWARERGMRAAHGEISFYSVSPLPP